MKREPGGHARLDVQALPKYPATGRAEAPDCSLGLPQDHRERAATGIGIVIGVCAAGVVGVFLLFGMLLYSRPVLFGLTPATLMLLLLCTGGTAFVLLLAIKAQPHTVEVDDYGD